MNGTLKGDGGTIGGYAAWRILPTLRLNATLAWSSISYDAAAGTASGSFVGHRWLASTGLTGSHRFGALIVEPSTKVFALWERQSEWTDSLGALQAEHDFSAGRVATGGRLIVPWQATADLTLSSDAGLYGDWRFGTDNAVPAGQPLVGIGNGWSGRVTGGLSATKTGGHALTRGRVRRSRSGLQSVDRQRTWALAALSAQFGFAVRTDVRVGSWPCKNVCRHRFSGAFEAAGVFGAGYALNITLHPTLRRSQEFTRRRICTNSAFSFEGGRGRSDPGKSSA